LAQEFMSLRETVKSLHNSHNSLIFISSVTGRKWMAKFGVTFILGKGGVNKYIYYYLPQQKTHQEFRRQIMEKIFH